MVLFLAMSSDEALRMALKVRALPDAIFSAGSQN
jgi:hypothetical protein